MAFLSGDQEILSKQNPPWHKTSLSISVLKFSHIKSALLAYDNTMWQFLICGKAKNKSKLNSAFDFYAFLEKCHYLSALHPFKIPKSIKLFKK